MPSSPRDRAITRALQRKCTLLDELARVYAAALEAMLAPDLARVGEHMDGADSILAELQQNDRLLEGRGVETPPETRKLIQDVHDLHGRLV